MIRFFKRLWLLWRIRRAVSKKVQEPLMAWTKNTVIVNDNFLMTDRAKEETKFTGRKGPSTRYDK